MEEKKQKKTRKDLKVELFEEYRLKNNLTKAAFCKLCGISIKTYDNILSKEHDFRVESILKIMQVVNVRFRDLF